LVTHIKKIDPGSGQVGFVVDKLALGQVSPSTSVSPANLHSTNCSTITLTYYLGHIQGNFRNRTENQLRLVDK
jgi:hypothetical protein